MRIFKILEERILITSIWRKNTENQRVKYRAIWYLIWKDQTQKISGPVSVSLLKSKFHDLNNRKSWYYSEKCIKHIIIIFFFVYLITNFEYHIGYFGPASTRVSQSNFRILKTDKTDFQYRKYLNRFSWIADYFPISVIRTKLLH